VGGKRAGFQSDLTFLKNAMGDGVHFCIEKGGSARANLLSQQHPNPQRKKRKLLDAAATRVGTTVTLLDKTENQEREKRRDADRDRQEQEKQERENGVDNNSDEDNAKGKNKDNNSNDAANNRDSNNGRNGKKSGTTGMDWLNNNISRDGLDQEMEKLRKQDKEQEELLLKANAEEESEIENQTKMVYLSDYIDPAMQAPSLWDENTRKVTFQSLYKKEIGRQTNLLHLPEHNETAGNFSSPPKGSFLAGNISIEDDQSISWEDG